MKVGRPGLARRVSSGVEGSGTGLEAEAGTSAAAAFAAYVVPQIEVLYRVARSLCTQPADAEDLVQDALLRAYRAIGGFDGAHPRAWLLTILRNAERNRHRRRRPALLDDPEEATERITAGPQGRAASPEELLCDAAFDAAVEAAVRALPLEFREVVALVDVQGLSYTQAAEVLGAPVGTVTSRLHRARGKIRRYLGTSGMAPKEGDGS
jgi:RNA polymerase sigma-70 factor (ECF subfamily)